MRDFLPRAAARRRAIAEGLIGVFESWGFCRIITPAFEYADVLERGLGDDARAAAVRFVEPHTGEVVALRPDITPQVARIAATHLGEVGGPLRLCYEGAVTRLTAGARGQREVLQAGVELIGVAGPEGDAEVIAVAAAALATARVSDLRLEIGHVALARAALAAVPDPARRAELKGLLAKRARAAVERAAAGLPDGTRALLAALPELYGEPAAVLARARALRLDPPERRALAAVERVLAELGGAEGPILRDHLVLDLGEVRGFEYYTGIRFAGYAAGVGDAVLRGGRYDELIGRYGGSAPATGFAVNIEAVAQAERAAGLAPPPPGELVLVVAAAAADRPHALRIAAGLRARGRAAAVHAGPRLAPAALTAYARAAGFSHVLALAAGPSRLIEVGAANGATRSARLTAAVVKLAARGDVGPLAAALRRPAWQSSS